MFPPPPPPPPPQVGYDVAKKAAETVYRKSGLGPQDVQVVELHDCFSANELITYEALGLCPVGTYLYSEVKISSTYCDLNLFPLIHTFQEGKKAF